MSALQVRNILCFSLAGPNEVDIIFPYYYALSEALKKEPLVKYNAINLVAMLNVCHITKEDSQHSNSQ
jgi:hypothetical protein